MLYICIICACIVHNLESFVVWHKTVSRRKYFILKISATVFLINLLGTYYLKNLPEKNYGIHYKFQF